MTINTSASKKIMANSLLLMITLFWGVTFIIVKEAVEKVGVFLFLSQRFLLAFIILLFICFILKRKVSLFSIKPGIILGTFLFGGYAFQTIALLYTTASNTAFLTGLNVIFVPVIGGFIFGHKITFFMKFGVLIATTGMFFLCTGQGLNLNFGDFYGAICAICIALHLIFTGRYAREYDIYWLTTIQIGTVAFLSMVCALFNEDRIFVFHQEIIWALFICVIFATIIAFLVQTSMQRLTSSTHTALIFCMEPVFAAIFAYFMLNERLGSRGVLGASLIFSGMILSQFSLLRQFVRKLDK